MQKLLMLRGLPGSGKSHWAFQFLAENPNWRRVSKDDLRQMLWGNSKPKNNERHLDRIQDEIITELLIGGFSVIVDNTHLSPRREAHLRDLVNSSGRKVEFEVKFFDTPVWKCILNDAGRPSPVGLKVIGRMYQQFLVPEPVARDESLEDAYIVDIDGTVAKMDGRSPFDYSKVSTDLPNLPVCMTIGALADTPHKIIFVSGRPDDIRSETITWLEGIRWSGFENPTLFMRKAGDNRQDAIIK